MTDLQRLDHLIYLCIGHKVTMYGYDPDTNAIDIKDAPFSFPSEHENKRLQLFLHDGHIEMDEWDESPHNGDIRNYTETTLIVEPEKMEKLLKWLNRSYEQLLKIKLREEILTEMVETRFEEIW